jgi:exopolysaccharide biosynthesis polyprenyl glycosylphosphotransferase
MRKKSELVFSLLLLPIDFAAIISSYVLAYIVRVKVDARPVAYPIGALFFLKIFLVVVPAWILIFALSGMYNLSSLRGRVEELGKTLVAVSGGAMLLILVDFFGRQPIFPSKAVAIYGYAFSLCLVVLGRQIVRKVQRELFKYNVGVHRTVLIGSGEIAQKLIPDLSQGHGFRLIGAVDRAKGAAKRLPGVKIYRSFGEIVRAYGRRNIDDIIQADSALGPDEILEVVNFAANQHIGFRFVPNQLGVYATHSAVSTMAGLPIVEIKQTPLDGWGRIVKRAFDLVGALVGIILASPLLLAIALAVKLTDRGPVLYKHTRLSREGKKIKINKFRTMFLQYCTGPGYSGKSDAEVLNSLGAGLAAKFKHDQKLADDPRVTTLGRWLRRTSLDELPQLFNVLAGSLSLVGPRPIVADELVRYGAGQSTFLALKPGVTGLWQTSGRNDLDYDERVKLDIYYVENWSLLLDIRILVRTILTLLKREGAY